MLVLPKRSAGHEDNVDATLGKLLGDSLSDSIRCSLQSVFEGAVNNDKHRLGKDSGLTVTTAQLPSFFTFTPPLRNVE